MQQAVVRKTSYLTPAQVADRYEGQISVRTLANWRYLGTGPAFSRLGGRVLYPEDKLSEWEAKRTVTSTSEYKK
jgi:predicted site-specific integrase-resolvase